MPRSAVGTGAAARDGERAFVLLEGHGLGAALAWSHRAGATEVHVVAEDNTGHLARQAAEFDTPISVWTTEGTDLVPVEPGPFDDTLGPPDAPELVAVLQEHGLDVVVEGDRLAGEFRGLEVVRIVRALDDGEPILEVGVGRFDRELTAMMHGELPDARSVARVVEQLRELRRPGGPNHPLAGLVPERWLRHTLLAEPERIGCDDLVAAPTPSPRDRLRERGVAAAVGTRQGAPVVVACTVGVHLEAVVLAADARLAIDPDATLLVALPERDLLPVNAALVADLTRPAEIAAVEGEWRT
ncbi:MAG: hypothetical protein U5K30_07980 [Acidimicrobiales bacterium]|nr:hypothetical protein [Acidimicrobiales bacterium]